MVELEGKTMTFNCDENGIPIIEWEGVRCLVRTAGNNEPMVRKVIAVLPNETMEYIADDGKSYMYCEKLKSKISRKEIAEKLGLNYDFEIIKD